MARERESLPSFNETIMLDIEDAINKFLLAMKREEFVLKAKFDFTPTQLTIHILLESD